MKHGITEGALAWPATMKKQKDGGVLVRFRDIGQATTQGDDMADAAAQARDALSEAIAAFIKGRMDIPAPTAPCRGEVTVRPDEVIALKALVYSGMRENGFSNVDMAARLGLDEKEIRRMIDPAQRGTKISRYAAALAVCHVEIEVAARSTEPLRIVDA